MPILGPYLERINHSYFDTFILEAPTPQNVIRFFSLPMGFSDYEKCPNCSYRLLGTRRRTENDTNMEMAGMIQQPRIFIAQSLQIILDGQWDAQDEYAFRLSYRVDFQRGKDVVFSTPVRDLLSNSGIALPCDPDPEHFGKGPGIRIESGMYFCPQLRLENPCQLGADLKGRFFVHGILFREVN